MAARCWLGWQQRLDRPDVDHSRSRRPHAAPPVDARPRSLCGDGRSRPGCAIPTRSMRGTSCASSRSIPSTRIRARPTAAPSSTTRSTRSCAQRPHRAADALRGCRDRARSIRRGLEPARRLGLLVAALRAHRALVRDAGARARPLLDALHRGWPGSWSCRMLGAGPSRCARTADRIDRLTDGTLAVIDYKTGALPEPERDRARLRAATAARGGDGGRRAASRRGAGEVGELALWRLTGGATAARIKPVDGDPMRARRRKPCAWAHRARSTTSDDDAPIRTPGARYGAALSATMSISRASRNGRDGERERQWK